MKAIIFDFDGVIADTMRDNCTAWQQAFLPFGFQLKSSEYYPLEGMGRYQIAQYFIEKYKLPAQIKNEVVEAKELYYEQNNQFKLYAEIPSILQLLSDKKIPYAIVTGASRKRIDANLDKTIFKNLSVLITADDVQHTKPHPEPYLKAVNQLGQRPEDCLVIENAILGIQSAKAAGCKCFGIETTLDNTALSIADEVVKNHKELLERLREKVLLIKG